MPECELLGPAFLAVDNWRRRPHSPADKMKSMTGYGRGECSHGGLKVTTEVSSVNRKQAEINVYLPRELDSLELQIRDEVNKRIARGRLTVKVAIQAGESFYGGKVQLNVPLAK